MNAAELRLRLEDALLTLEASRDELRDLDAAIGDGDLGITVSEGARAIRGGLHEPSGDERIAGVLRICAQRFASANPSTMSALVASGLLAAAKSLGDTPTLDRAGCLLLLETATTTIQARGKAELGDKTVLDALHPTIEVLRSSGPDDHDTLGSMIDTAQRAVNETAELQSRRGRAAWVGERTVGRPDGGATAYLRLLQALDRATRDPAPDGS